MAIAPPSDILLDVANAADPTQVRLAAARLAKIAADPAATESNFAEALSSAGRGGKNLSAPAPLTQAIGAPLDASLKGSKAATAAYQKFETLLLQNFVESMLPKDDELYGDKESAGVYRSMMAEQFATQLSKGGGIGIAKSIAAKHPAHLVETTVVKPKDA